MDTVAVTGGAAGLGAVIARRLVDRGRPVVLVDRDTAALAATSASLTRAGGVVATVVADLSSMPGAEQAALALTALGDIGVLVHNAGGWLPGPQYPEAGADRWSAALTLNLLAPMLLTQRLWPRLAAGSGAVVHIGSSGGEGDDAYGSPEYGAAKAGIRRFTSSLADRTDVRVMAVVPGWIGLERAHAEWSALPPERQREVGPLIPPDRVADVVLDLLDRGTAGEVVELLRGATVSDSTVK